MGSWVDIINERPPVMEEEDKQSLVESEMGLETSSKGLEVASFAQLIGCRVGWKCQCVGV